MSVGWDHLGWMGEFYPDDLPDDWRLTYYANEFRGVLVPESSWLDAQPERLEQWKDDVSEGFRFYLELDRFEVMAESRLKFEALGEALGGIIMPCGFEDQARVGVPLFQARRPGRHESTDLPSAWIVEGVAADDLLRQRRLLESIVSESPTGSEMPLFVQGNPPSLELMRNLRQLTQLMGLS